MTRDINLSTSSSRTSSRSTGKQGGLVHTIKNNGSINAHSEHGRTTDEEDERLREKGRASLAGGSRRSPRRSIRSRSLLREDNSEANGMNAVSSSRAARYTARTARKSRVSLPEPQGSEAASHAESSDEDEATVAIPRARRRNMLFSSTSYSTLFTITIALLAWSMIQPTQAASSCTTDADCSAKGSAKCKQDRMTGASTCVYKSCAAGFWGAGNTYSDCFECPKGMTSLEGKAFYKIDCFLPCGDDRCYIPEDGSTECNFEAATAKQMCYSTCNDASFTVINANRPYATCVRKSQVVVNPNSTSLTNQANSVPNKRKVVKLLTKRREVDSGRRLKLKKDVDLRHQGPAVALLRDAGRDPLALVSK